MEVCQITQCSVSSLSNFITLDFFSPFHQLLLSFLSVILCHFSCNSSSVSHFPCQRGILFSEQAGQAGCRSILRLKLHGREAVCPTDEVVFGEAAGCDVVLQELLGKVLMHLRCLVGVHGVSTGLVQIFEKSGGPELHRHIWDLAGQLHGRNHHIVTFPVVAENKEDVTQ